MSQSPTKLTNSPDQAYMDAWQDLATRIRNGNSFSGREPNSCFLNTRGERFADISMMSGLGLEDDGRSIATVDWDHDGDLDLWITNRTAPRVRFLRNDYGGGQFLAVQLQGDPAKGVNRDAIGAVVTVTLADGNELVKTVTAGNGFLSQSSKWLHFGLGENKAVTSVQVIWKGKDSLESFPNLKPGQRYQLTQGSGLGQPSKTNSIQLNASELPALPPSTLEVTLTEPKPAPSLNYRTWTGENVMIDTVPPTLVLLWASWCQPCLEELAALSKEAAALKKAGVNVIALNIEEAQDDNAPNLKVMERSLQKLGWPFASGRATEALVRDLDDAQRSILYKQEALPLPSSFLWRQNQLISFTKGPLSLPHLQRGLARLSAPATKHPDHAVPFPGRWSTDSFVTNPVSIAKVYLQGGYTEDARIYLTESLSKLDTSDAQIAKLQEADLRFMIAETLRLENRAPSEALPFYQEAVRLHPQHPSAVTAYARALAAARRGEEAIPLLQGLLKLQPKRADVQIQLGDICQGLLRDQEAVTAYAAALQLKPDDFQATTQLCWVYATSADPKVNDPGKALPLAQQLLQKHGRNLYALDTAAAALAISKRFPQAIQLAERALQMAKQSGDARLAQNLQQRLALYRSNQPFVRR